MSKLPLSPLICDCWPSFKYILMLWSLSAFVSVELGVHSTERSNATVLGRITPGWYGGDSTAFASVSAMLLYQDRFVMCFEDGCI